MGSKGDYVIPAGTLFAIAIRQILVMESEEKVSDEYVESILRSVLMAAEQYDIYQ